MPIVTLADLQAREFPNVYRNRAVRGGVPVQRTRLGLLFDFSTVNNYSRRELITIYVVLVTVLSILVIPGKFALFKPIVEATNGVINLTFIVYLILSIAFLILYNSYKIDRKDLGIKKKYDFYEGLATYGIIFVGVNVLGLLLPTNGAKFWDQQFGVAFGIYIAFVFKAFFDGFVFRGFFTPQLLNKCIEKYGEGLKGYYLGLLYSHLLYTGFNIPFIIIAFPLSHLFLQFLMYFISTVYLIFIHQATGNVFVSIVMHVLYTVPALITVDDATGSIFLFIALLVILFAWRFLPHVKRRNGF
ncbi:hypothetical protein RCL1_001674 [Eukaryota sp. TZLM3-RCL]